MIYKFTPESETLAQVRKQYSANEVTNEIGVYAASPDKVKSVCGPIANSILNSVPSEWYEKCKDLGMLPNIDVRIHRLNKGEYPAVPGWHCDGALRETFFGQPDLNRVRIRDTILCIVSTGDDGVSNPEIATEEISIDVPDDVSQSNDFVLWKHVHNNMPKEFSKETLKDGQITLMSCNTLHRVMPAHTRGSRLFFRMSMWHNDYLGDGGKIVQCNQKYRVITEETVYVESESSGW